MNVAVGERLPDPNHRWQDRSPGILPIWRQPAKGTEESNLCANVENGQETKGIMAARYPRFKRKKTSKTARFSQCGKYFDYKSLDLVAN